MRPAKKPAKPYHHGDLRRALLDEALRTIQTHGVEHLTLRTVGEKLGVSRSAALPALCRQTILGDVERAILKKF
jgi:AcrR family transcriptional regulator